MSPHYFILIGVAFVHLFEMKCVRIHIILVCYMKNEQKRATVTITILDWFRNLKINSTDMRQTVHI